MGTTEANITNRIQEMEEKISGVEDTIQEVDSLVKENIKSNKFLTKHPGNLEDQEKTKPKNNRDRRRRKTAAQRHIKYIQQHHKRQLSQPK